PRTKWTTGMRRPELTPARSRSRRAHHADATRRRLIGGSRLKRLLADAELEKDALREIAKGKF
ncbi:hypothetical protein, partial [Gordonia aurantiaca]|uniref:hypothetical protein n=1 Tax=Gordonia sp. B21 TaxID=3151852 RepID=UPI003263F495